MRLAPRGFLLCALVSCAAPVMDAPPAPVPVQVAPPRAAESAPATMPPELLMEVLASISVSRLLPDLASRTEPVYGAIPLAQVAEAIERAQADMFVAYVANASATLPISDFTLVD